MTDPEEKDSPGEAQGPEEESSPTPPPRRKSSSSKWILSILAVVVLGAGVFVGVKVYLDPTPLPPLKVRSEAPRPSEDDPPSADPPEEEAVKGVEPAEEESTERKIDLIFAAESREEEIRIVVMEIRLDFKDVDSSRYFKENVVRYRDVVYRFLSSRKPPKNSYRHWQALLEDDLRTHLQETLPRGALKSLRLDYMYKL